VHIGDEEPQVATVEDAVRLPLTGGWVATAWGEQLHRVQRAVDALAPGRARATA
jgi:urease accessory protein